MKSAELLNVDRVNDPKVGWLPLVVEGALANSVEDISRNIEHAIGLDYIPFNELIETKSGAVAVVGSGPSLKKTWHKLKNFKGDIIACNAACQFLLEKGIVPQYMMCFDADKLVLGFFTKHLDITYLIASRCVPQVFDVLKDCKIVVWHASGDKTIRELLEKHEVNEPMVIGGSAAVTRTMILAMPMGYTEIHIYGGDSSFADGDTHIRQSTTTERRMAVKCAGRVFEVAPWMTIQVEDLKKLAPLINRLKIKLFVHGDGLLQHVARELGFRTDYENAVQKWIREFVRDWTHKATILWQHV
jgi:uncharacterized Rossmann fold enzyme